jgi:hypothetical protein
MIVAVMILIIMHSSIPRIVIKGGACAGSTSLLRLENYRTRNCL